MDEKFKKKYGIYDGIDTSAFKYIPEISFYNNNYFVGLKRDKNVTNDLLFAHSDDDWYVLNGSFATYIGYEFTDKGVINLSDEPFT